MKMMCSPVLLGTKTVLNISRAVSTQHLKIFESYSNCSVLAPKLRITKSRMKEWGFYRKKEYLN